MKIRTKKSISPLMKLLIITETLAVVLLLGLCAYKQNMPGFRSLFDEPVPDVILDAGHGGYDTGAMAGEVMEKDITLSMTKKIGKKIEDSGYVVSYIRDSDDASWATNEKSDLRYRVKEVNESGAKLFISIHANSEEVNSNSYGFEIWGKIKNKQVFKLSKNILNAVSTLNYSQNRGMKDQDLSPLYVLNNSKVPAVLFEVGFLGSDQDRMYMEDGPAQKKFCDKTAQGIIDTLKQMEKEEKAKEKPSSDL